MRTSILLLAIILSVLFISYSNADCSDESEYCRGNQYCSDEGICKALIKNGDFCDNDAQCETFYCNSGDGTCSDIPIESDEYWELLN